MSTEITTVKRDTWESRVRSVQRFNEVRKTNTTPPRWFKEAKRETPRDMSTESRLDTHKKINENNLLFFLTHAKLPRKVKMHQHLDPYVEAHSSGESR